MRWSLAWRDAVLVVVLLVAAAFIIGASASGGGSGTPVPSMLVACAPAGPETTLVMHIGEDSTYLVEGISRSTGDGVTRFEVTGIQNPNDGTWSVWAPEDVTARGAFDRLQRDPRGRRSSLPQLDPVAALGRLLTCP